MIRRRCARGHQACAGQTTVEFASVVMVFLMIAFVTMKLALAVYNYNMICSAAREAARYAITHGPNSANPASIAQIQQVAVDAAPGLSLSTSNVTVNWLNDPSLPSRKDAQIQVTYPYTLRLPFMAARTLTLSSTSQMLAAQ